jgi:signal transduction histidine kinase
LTKPANDSAVPSPDLNLRLLRHLVRYLTDHHTAREIESIAGQAGVPVADLMGGTGWVSLEQFEILLARARALMPDDATFMTACAYKLDAVSGPIRFMLSAVSPIAAYEAGAKNMRLVSQISAFEPEVLSRNRVRIGYRSTKQESRLMCLSRQAQIRGLPTLWDLPPAHIDETTCVARGDARCSYDVRFYEARRWAPLAIGTGVATALGAVLQFGLAIPVDFWWFALVGAAASHLYEIRRISRANHKTQEEINAAYLQMARDEASARRELFAVTQRQKTWGHLMEHEVVGREDALRHLAEELSDLGRGGDSSRPTARIRSQVEQLRELGLVRSERVDSALSLIDIGIDELDRRLARASRLASEGRDGLLLAPEWLEVTPLVTELRNRIRGLVSSRDVRVSVFAVREAPYNVFVDPLLFNRIIDNLLLNAAKHTEVGSIVVEISGTPGYLTIKVSDTGRGVPEGEIGTLFRPLERTGLGFAYHAGLSVVVQLLGRIGGKLEVMSRPGEGTTFWAHFPVETPQEAAAEAEGTPVSQTVERLLSKVVTVRRYSEG